MLIDTWLVLIWRRLRTMRCEATAYLHAADDESIKYIRNGGVCFHFPFE